MKPDPYFEHCLSAQFREHDRMIIIDTRPLARPVSVWKGILGGLLLTGSLVELIRLLINGRLP